MSAEGPQSPSGVIFLKLLRRCALVAQLDRAFGYEPKGRRFESFRAHHLKRKVAPVALITFK